MANARGKKVLERKGIAALRELTAPETDKRRRHFDTSTMPWRHEKPRSDWLESNLDSRIIKSIVLTEGQGQFGLGEYPQKIDDKDESHINLVQKPMELK